MKLSPSKALIIGLDSATFDLIDPWIKAGKLPTLAQCMKKGTRGILLSTPLSNSAQAWSTFVTGKNSGKHGIFDFFEKKPGSYDVRFVNASFRKGKSLWEIASEFGKMVTVINVPMSYPVQKVKGIILSGLDAPGITKGFAYPANIIKEIINKVGPYILEPGIWGYIRRGKRNMALGKLLETIKIRTETAKYLMSTYPWDFFMIVFTESDKVQHHFWKYMGQPGPYHDAILKIYQHLDHSIKELCQLIDKQTQVYIVSDHGAGPSTNRTFYINKWLNSEKILEFKKDGIKEKLLNTIIKQADCLIKTKLPRKTKEGLARTFPHLRSKVESVLSLSGVNWLSTKAYSRENQPAIFINLKGREPLGIVEPGEEYYKIRSMIAKKIMSLICPETGEKIVDQVRFKEKIFWGEQTDKAPDIIFKWRNNRYIHRPSTPYSRDGFIKILTKKELDNSESFHRPSGVHRAEGILIAFGPGISVNKNLAKAKLMDIAPTVLYGLEIPVPEDMDGSILVNLFEQEFIKNRPIIYGKKKEECSFNEAKEIYDAEEEVIIQDRLKGLGYID